MFTPSRRVFTECSIGSRGRNGASFSRSERGTNGWISLLKRLVCHRPTSYPQMRAKSDDMGTAAGFKMTTSRPQLALRRAVLIFAEATPVELARRAFPNAARPLLKLPAFGTEFSRGIDVHLFTSGRGSIPSTPRVHRQTGPDFGARLENAIARIDELGYDEVVVIGSDCPTLRPIDIEHAFGKLGSRKLVLGPDHRGGCYLIGFRSCRRGGSAQK